MGLVNDVRNVIHDAVVVDKVRLNQIVLNLLSNAVKYTPRNGHVSFALSELSAAGNAAHYEIVVSDNGYGMSADSGSILGFQTRSI